MRTKLKAFVLVLIVAYGSITIVHSQESAGFISSPEGMSTVGAIQSSVTNTGAINVQIPLYTVSSGSIQVPIGLSYVSSGIKVDELPTCVGLGWKLSAGGKITRVVKTRPDDKKGTYGLWFYWGDVCGSTAPGTIDYYKKIYNKYYNVTPTFNNYVELDGEADIFYFEIPGNAGMFVLDHNGTAHTIPYQNLSIQWVDREDEDDKDYFIITDANGCKYTFGNNNSKEISKVVYTDPNRKEGKYTVEYTSTWWLDKIEPFSGDPVTFLYMSGNDISFKKHSYIYTAKRINGSYDDFDITEKDYSVNTTIYSPKHINEISSKEGKVKFTLSFNSTSENSRKIDAFQVYNCYNTKIKDITFQYSTYSNDHLKLVGISEINGSHTTPLYRFGYISYFRPPTDTKDFDHWGYYNGKDNTTYRAAASKLSYPIPGGADRQPNHSLAMSGLLNSITYHNGKATKFVYEANDIGYNSVKNKITGGVRVCEILTIASGLQSSIKYLYKKEGSDNLSSGITYNSNPEYLRISGGEIIIYSYSYQQIFDLAGRNIEYSRITEMYPNGSKVVKEYTNFETSDEYADQRERVFFKKNGYFLSSPSGFYDGFHHYDTRFWRRGLQTRTLTYAASSPTPIQTIENTYAFGPIKDTVECYLPQFSHVDTRYLSIYKWVSEPVSLTKTTVSQGPYNLPSETSYEYDEFQRPKTITQVDCENNIYKTRIKYASDYGTINPIGEDATAIKYIAQNLGGANLPIETIMYKNGMVVGGNINAYKHTPDDVNKLVLDRTYDLVLYQPISSSFFQESACVTNFVFNGNYQPTMYYDEYGEGNLLLSSHKPNGIQESVIYGYGNTLPVAKVTNARHSIREGMNEVYYSSFEEPEQHSKSIPFSKAKSGERVLNKAVVLTLTGMKSGGYVISYWEYDVSRQVWSFVENDITSSGSYLSYNLPASASKYIDEVRIMPRGAYMTTSTYNPGVGKLSETDANGRSIHYEYNEFGLLAKIYNDDWILIKEINYDDL